MSFAIEDDDSIVALYSKVVRLHFLRSRAMLETIGLYPGQPQLLAALKRFGAMSQKALSELMMIKPATVNVMIQRMVKVGFVVKKQDKEDLRKSIIDLTPQGEKKYFEFSEIHRMIEEECCAGLNAEEIETLKLLLIKIQDSLLQKLNAKEQNAIMPCQFQERKTK